MATTTTNYKLTKPDIKEKVNVGVINQNMDVIDTNLKSISDKVGDAEKNVIIGIQKNGTDLSVDSSTRKVNVTVPTKVSQLENDLGFKTTDNNTTYGVATSSTLGLVKSGADITVDSSGNVNVNDDSHNHTIENVDGLQDVLDEINNDLANCASKTDIPTLVAGNNITLTPNADSNKITISSTGGGSGTISSLTDLGVTATADELNYVDGVTSNIQTQLNNKVSIRRAIVGQSSSTTTKPYYKFASTTITKANFDSHISFRVQKRYGAQSKVNGILTAHMRTGTIGTMSSCEFVWEYANEAVNPDDFIFCYKATSGTSVTIELYVNIPTAWAYYNFDVISEGERATSNAIWTLHTASSAGQLESLPSDYTKLESSLARILNPAGLIYSSTEPTTRLATNMVWIG